MINSTNTSDKKADLIVIVSRAQTLAGVIMELLGTQRLKESGSVVIYSEEVKAKYSNRTLELVKNGVFGNFSYKYDKVLNQITNMVLMLNLDKVVSESNDNGFSEIARKLDIQNTKTNLFIFTVMHELGHFTQVSLLHAKGYYDKLMEFNKLNSQLPRDFLDSDYSNMLNVEELFSDLYAFARIGGVIKELGRLDQEYLTYLD